MSATVAEVKAGGVLENKSIDAADVGADTTGTAAAAVAAHVAAADPHTGYLKESEYTGAGKVLKATGAGAVTTIDSTAAATGSTIAERDADGDLVARQLESTVSTGTPPLAVASTTEVPNLNAAQVGGRTPAAASGVATLDNSSKTVEDPASAQTAAAASKIPISGADGTVAAGYLATGTPGAGDTIVYQPDGSRAWGSSLSTVIETHVFDTVAITTDAQTLTCVMTDSNGTNYSRLVKAHKPSATPNVLEIDGSGRFHVQIDSADSAADMYSSGSAFNAPGIRIPLSPYYTNLAPGQELVARCTMSLTKPTSFNAAGEWIRPLIAFIGTCPSDGGVRSWVTAFIEANTGSYDVGSSYAIGASGGTVNFVSVASGTLTTGYDLELVLTWDGKITFRYRETGAGAYTDSASARWTRGLIVSELGFFIAYGDVDAGAGTCDAYISDIEIEVS